MRIYCDSNASTPIDPRVLEIYLSALKNAWANPSSPHHEGQVARSMLAEARELIAKLFHVSPRQILFYSSATEALNTLILSLFKNIKAPLVTTNIDHPAVFEPCSRLSQSGRNVLLSSVGEEGALTLQDELLVGGVVTFLANNETGCITDIGPLSLKAQKENVPLLLDGVAALGKMDVSLLPGISAICFASHKVYAPKGVGLAVLSKNVSVEPLLLGGHQESGRRAGTENVPAIFAFAKALEFLFHEQTESIERLSKLRDHFEEQLIHSIPHIEINGKRPRVCNVSNLFIEGVQAEELMMLLDQMGFAISVGSACSSGALEPSRVITNMYTTQRALSSVRISFHKWTTDEEVEKLSQAMTKAVCKLRG